MNAPRILVARLVTFADVFGCVIEPLGREGKRDERRDLRCEVISINTGKLTYSTQTYSACSHGTRSDVSTEFDG